jgi:8-oxo-dGTP diphosphatase
MTTYCLGFLFAWAPYGRRVALVRKARPEWQKGRLNGVGGKVESGESPAEAMVREFAEEAVGGDHRAYLAWQPSGGWREYAFLLTRESKVHVFAGLHGDLAFPLKSDGTDEPAAWFDPDALPADALPNLRWLIPMALDADVFHARVGYQH